MSKTMKRCLEHKKLQTILHKQDRTLFKNY